jgi:hypothetical protein
MVSLYRSLLYLYPPAHRHEYGEEMMAVFREVQGVTANQGMPARALFWVREVQGLLAGALREHLRTITGSHYPSMPIFSRRLSMHSEFRFPKATVTLMTIILAAVVMAIEKATAIQNSIPPSSPHVGPIQPTHFTFLPTLILILLFACLVGILGWVILFALHRSGAQRLADFDPSRERSSAGGLRV